MLTVLFFIILLASAVFHEYMHGWVADQLGDPTARDLGRLTLNPLAHIDPLMTLALPAYLLWVTGGRFMFAAAKPVPFNPYNLKYPRYGPALVGIAGPLGNLTIAATFAAIVRFVPLPEIAAGIFAIVVWTNVSLAIFNLVPIPPLDGSHLLFSLLPSRWYAVSDFLQRYGIVLFVIFVVFFSSAIVPLIETIASALLGAQGIAYLE